MTIEEIQSRKEGQTFDRKSINIKPKDLAPTIIAMANADGGDINSEGLPNHVLVLHIEPGLRVYANQADEVYLRVGDKSKKLTFDERLQLMNDKGQEIIVNAVCHRDYSIAGTEIQIKLFNDRLVVESPGKLPGLVNKDNIRYTHFSRNPRIAQYLKAYKYVKEYGEGVDRMCREMEEDGLQPIRYYCNDFILKAIALNKEADSVIAEDGKVAVTWDEIRSTCNANAVKILEYLSSHQSITNAVAREITGLSSPGVRKILSNLVENKIIRSIGTYRDKSYSLVRHFEDKVSR